MSDIIAASERAGLEAQSGTERPLSDQERALVQRILSDPFAFPIQFKTWLVSFLEGSDLLLPRSSVQGLSSLLGSGGGQGVLGLLPAGIIFPGGAAAAPIGALLCNGAAYSTTAYKRLFDEIGFAYGGSGGNFNVPDLRRRLPFGMGTGLGIGSSDGRAEASRHIDHHHFFGQTSNADGAHSHGVSASGSTGGGGTHRHPARGPNFGSRADQPTAAGGTLRYAASDPQFDTGDAGDHSHSVSVSGGTDTHGGHSHFVQGDTSGGFDNNRPAFLVVNFIINY